MVYEFPRHYFVNVNEDRLVWHFKLFHWLLIAVTYFILFISKTHTHNCIDQYNAYHNMARYCCFYAETYNDEVTRKYLKLTLSK